MEQMLWAGLKGAACCPWRDGAGCRNKVCLFFFKFTIGIANGMSGYYLININII